MYQLQGCILFRQPSWSTKIVIADKLLIKLYYFWHTLKSNVSETFISFRFLITISYNNDMCRTSIVKCIFKDEKNPYNFCYWVKIVNWITYKKWSNSNICMLSKYMANETRIKTVCLLSARRKKMLELNYEKLIDDSRDIQVILMFVNIES